VQARSHIVALRLVRPGIKDIRIWSRTAANAEKLATETGARVVTIEEAAAADVVLTVTASPEPVLQGKWLGPDALVLAVGATGAGLRELDDEAMQSSYVVAECRAAAEREAGDVRLSGMKVEAEIGEILAGRVAAPSGRRIVFKSVGMAIEDLTAARLVWQARNHPA
jgi:thiomorpholine-carboxylate dehydrogenase